MTTSVLDDALERLRGTGPELSDSGPNHGPMVVEALIDLGCGDLIPSWLDQYTDQLGAPPARSAPIGVQTWKQALGARQRSSDWETFFNDRLGESPWQVVLSTWLPRLMPGVMAYGTHGLIRTAHATRALSVSETPPRLVELAAGLATWAAYYQPLPGVPRLTGARDVARALDALPHLPSQAERRGPPPRVVRALDNLAAFPDAVDALAIPTSIDVSLSELSEAGAHLYLANAERHPLVFVHAVTGPAALRAVLPYLTREEQLTAFAYVWQAVAAWAAAFGSGSADPMARADADDPGARASDNIKARSIDTQDQHAIKFLAACLRETELNPTPAYLRAADDWANRMLEARSWTHSQRMAAGLVAV
jgi:Questin oxidase-like